MTTENSWPALPLDQWEDTKNTLHLYCQMVGKVRMALHPKMNHWWHVPLYLSTRGITTRTIPYGDRSVELEIDCRAHQLTVSDSDGDFRAIDLPGLNVARFHHELFSVLDDMSVEVAIKSEPYDCPFSTEPFTSDENHGTYDTESVHRFWRAMLSVNNVFESFRARFIGKSTPVHLFWHHLDLALTRFSGRAAPYEGGTAADREAYSHEAISFGFWAGDQTVREAAFYAYAYPEPPGLAKRALEPAAASWNNAAGFAMAFLPYEAVRTSSSPAETLLAFLDSAYRNAAELAAWDAAGLALHGAWYR